MRRLSNEARTIFRIEQEIDQRSESRNGIGAKGIHRALGRVNNLTFAAGSPVGFAYTSCATSGFIIRA